MTDETEDKYLHDEAVKVLGKLEKEAKKKKVLAGKTRDKYKQIRKTRLSRVNKENASLIKVSTKTRGSRGEHRRYRTFTTV